MPGFGRLHADAADIRVELLQPAGGADERATGAETGDEVGDGTPRLLPDLECGRVVVSPPVGLYVVLVGHEVPVRVFLVDGAGHANRTVAALHGVAVHDLRPVGMHELLALAAHVGRHHQLDAIALGRSHHRVRNPGVAAGVVDDDPVAGERTAPLAVLDHAQRRSVLHGPARVHEFDLGVDGGVRRVRLEEPHAQQGRVADAVADAQVANFA